MIGFLGRAGGNVQKCRNSCPVTTSGTKCTARAMKFSIRILFVAALLLARPPQVGECLAQVGGRREISADGVHISPIDVLMKLQQKPEWADVSISLVHHAIAAAPKADVPR